MFLVVTNERDITSDYIVLELQRRGLPFVRLNTEHISDAKVSFDPSRGEDAWVVALDNIDIGFSTVKAAYFRRPGFPCIPESIKQASARRYCECEWNSMISFALNSLEGRWLNSPLKIFAAENKPRQLSLACKIGFSVPETLITNDYKKVQRFLAEGVGVAKPLREALLEEGDTDRVIFTNRIDRLVASDEAKVAAAPVIYQREIKKTSDIRATVIGEAVYAAEILSQEYDETETDWRRGTRPDLPHKIHELPKDIYSKCVQIVKDLGLRFGTIDLVHDLDGKYWFLEVNPNGQWAWIENRTGMGLTNSIVDELERIASCLSS